VESSATGFANFKTLLKTPGTVNSSSNPVDFTELKNVPTFAISGYSAGTGIAIDPSTNTISSTVAAGPEGPQGPQGPTGNQGPPGPNPGSNIVYRCIYFCPNLTFCERVGTLTTLNTDCYDPNAGHNTPAGAQDTGLRVQ